MKRKINKNDVLKDPHIKWNKFVELIACEGYDDMTKIQRKAHLVFYFEQEMQNGGIAQYFTNQKTERLDELMEALELMKAKKQLELLTEITEMYLTLDLGNFNNRYEFLNEVFVGYDYKFKDSDTEDKYDQIVSKVESSYYNCKPTIVDYLEKYLHDNENEFVVYI